MSVFAHTVDRNVERALNEVSTRSADFTAGMVGSARTVSYSIFGGLVVSHLMVFVVLSSLPYHQANLWLYDSAASY